MFRKIIFISAFIAFIGQGVKSQSLRFGVFANPVISWMKTDISKIEGDGTVIGVNFGLMADKYFAEHYAFSTGLSLHNMGGVLWYKDGKLLRTSEGIDTVQPGKRIRYNLQYIHVPFALKFKTNEIGYITYFAQLGLDPMVNVRTRATVKDQGISSVNASKEINPFYMAYHLSAGIEYKLLGNTAVVAGLTYMNGFTDVTDDTSQKAVMHNVELRIGVIF